MSQALYNKWRPRAWEEVVGQSHVVETLKNAIRSERVGHAYLMAGPRGTGKTTTARLLAKAVNCTAPQLADRPCDQCECCQAVNEGRFLDLIEIDAASNTSVDDIRELREKINFLPSMGNFKVYIIDEVHMLSTAAFNALLKTLEEPPAHAIFILATTEIHKIPATVLSRCQRHEFRRIPVSDIVDRLALLCQKESIQASTEALTLIARQATGAMRDAISLLDMLASTGEMVTLEQAQVVLGTATSQRVIDLSEAICARNAGAALDEIHAALDTGTDPRQFARQMVDYLRGLLLVKLGSPGSLDASKEALSAMTNQAAKFDTAHLLDVIRMFNSAANDLRSGWQPGLSLELAAAEAVGWSQQVAPAAPVASPSTGHKPSALIVQPIHNPTEGKPADSKPQTSSPPEQVVPPTPPEGGVTLALVQQNWMKVRAVIKRDHPQLEALLNSTTSMIIRDGVLILGFASDVLKSKMETEENLDLTRQAVQQVLGTDLPIACTVLGKKATASPDDMGIDADGIVGNALRLGGKITHKE
jgi:DNA polymerase-3 subunit gamma/tau